MKTASSEPSSPRCPNPKGFRAVSWVLARKNLGTLHALPPFRTRLFSRLTFSKRGGRMNKKKRGGQRELQDFATNSMWIGCLI